MVGTLQHPPPRGTLLSSIGADASAHAPMCLCLFVGRVASCSVWNAVLDKEPSISPNLGPVCPCRGEPK